MVSPGQVKMSVLVSHVLNKQGTEYEVLKSLQTIQSSLQSQLFKSVLDLCESKHWYLVTLLTFRCSLRYLAKFFQITRF